MQLWSPTLQPSTIPYAQAVPGAVIGKYVEESDNALVIAPEKLIDFLTYLRDTEGYDYLGNLSCTDYSAYKGKQRGRD